MKKPKTKAELLDFLKDLLDYAVLRLAGSISNKVYLTGVLIGLKLHVPVIFPLDMADFGRTGKWIRTDDSFFFVLDKYFKDHKFVMYNLYLYKTDLDLSTNCSGDHSFTFTFNFSDEFLLLHSYATKNYPLVKNILISATSLKILRGALNQQRHVGKAKDILIAVINGNPSLYPCLKQYLTEKERKDNFDHLETADDYGVAGTFGDDC